MKRDEARKYIEIFQAYADGKPIQERELLRGPERSPWLDVKTDDIDWSFDFWEYRIKPSPRTWYILIPDGYGAAVGCKPVPTVVEDGDYANYAGTAIKVREVLDGD